MGSDLNADAHAIHGVRPEVIAEERAKIIADLAELDRDAEAKLAELAPDLACARRQKREALARLEALARPRFDIETLAERRIDLDTQPPPAPLLLTHGHGVPFMRSGIVASLVAPGGTGKTFALIQLAAAIGSGTRWLGTYEPRRKGRVFLGLAEEDDDEVRRRLWQATRQLSEYERGEVLRNVAAHGLAGRDVAFLKRRADKSVGASEWFAILKEALTRSGPWRAVILDPWSRWGGVDAETDAHAATTGVRLLEELTRLEGAPTVIAAHHTRKPSAAAKGPADASDARGSSAFVDGGRFTMNLSRRPKGELLSLRVTKTNGTVPGPELILARGEEGVLRPATDAERADEDASGEPTPKRSRASHVGSAGAERAAGKAGGAKAWPS